MKKILILAPLLLGLLLTMLLGSPANAEPKPVRPVDSLDHTVHASKINTSRHRVAYLAVGDSITWGVGANPGKSYPDQAGVRSLAQGGSCVSDSCGALSFRTSILPRLLALPNQPTTVILHEGVNDLVLGTPADVLIQRMIGLRTTLRSYGYRVVIGTIIPSPRESIWSTQVGGETRTVQQERLLFNDWVRTQHLHIEYARPLQCDGGYQCPGMSNLGDPHVNDRGAHIMAKVLRTWIERDAA